MNRFNKYILLILFLGGKLFSQNDSIYFAGLAERFRNQLKTNLDSAKYLANEIKKESNEKKYTKGKGLGSNYIGLCYLYEGKYDTAISYFNEAVKFFEISKSNKGLCDVYSNIGICYDYQGKFPEAIRNYIKTLNVAEAMGDSVAIARACNNLGAVYFQRQENEMAMSWFKRSLKIREQNNDNYGIASCCLNIASCLDRKNKQAEFLSYMNRCIANARIAGDSVLIADACISMAQNYSEHNDHQKAISYYHRIFPIYVSFNDPRSLSQLNYYLGLSHLHLKDWKNSHRYFLRSYNLAREINSLDLIKASSADLIVTSAYLGKPDSSSFYLGKYQVARDSLHSESNAKQIADMQTKYETDKKDRELKVKDLEIEKNSLESREKSFVIYVSLFGLVLMGALLFFIFKGYRQKKQSLVEISHQKKIIEEKNKDITDSINYAKRIQEVILPPMENETPLFPDSFILFKPKDVISGDFYWYTRKNGRKIVAAVDCTGHGVPGALMSMLGSAFLNEIVNGQGILKPSDILSELRNKVKLSLKQTGEVGASKDGMDMALLSFNEDNSQVEFAGANNPLWICTKKSGEFVMNHYAPDKRPIGYFMGKSLPFTNHIIDLNKGDMLYIFSDGYADQFGGSKGKKFKYKQLEALLISICEKDPAEQKKILYEKFEEWRGNLEQVDDVLIVAVRV